MIPREPRRRKKKLPGSPLGHTNRTAAIPLGSPLGRRRMDASVPGIPKSIPKKGGKSNPAPASTAAASRAAAVTASSPDAATIIGNYNLERAKILKGLAPQIQGIYDQSNTALQNTVGGLSQSLHDTLYQQGGAHDAAFGLADPRIAASYNPDAAPQALSYLGAALPGSAMEAQGKAFSAAAAFAPGAALQEGQYAIGAAVRDAAEAAAKAGATNDKLAGIDSSASKLIGYLVDKAGRPITGKNGKPIPIKAPEMTPYQQASLGLQAGRLDASIQGQNARLAQGSQRIAVSQAAQERADRRYFAGLGFRSDQAAATARANSKKIDSAASKTRGFLVNKQGDPILDKHNRVIKVTDGKAGKKQPSVTQNIALDKMVSGWRQGTRTKVGSKSVLKPDGSRVSNYIVKSGSPRNYQAGLRTLMKQYKLSLDAATTLLDSHYARGEFGRPYLSLQEARKFTGAKYKKWGITTALLVRARRGVTKDSYAAAHALKQILAAHGIAWAE